MIFVVHIDKVLVVIEFIPQWNFGILNQKSSINFTLHVYLTNNLELHEKRWFRYSKWVLWLNKNTWILLLLFFRLITCLKWSIKWFINSNPKLPLNWNKNYLLPFWKQFLNRTFDMQLQKKAHYLLHSATTYNI